MAVQTDGSRSAAGAGKETVRRGWATAGAYLRAVRETARRLQLYELVRQEAPPYALRRALLSFMSVAARCSSFVDTLDVLSREDCGRAYRRLVDAEIGAVVAALDEALAAFARVAGALGGLVREPAPDPPHDWPPLDALVEALAHLGRPYDFEFDFTSGTRVVCTGLVYRSFHGKGAIRFDLVPRMGRFTLSGDDLVGQALDARNAATESDSAPFQFVGLALRRRHGGVEFVPPRRIPTLLSRIRRGWRPLRSGGRRKPATPDAQLALFGPVREHPLIERLRLLDVNQITPLEALALLAELVADARAEDTVVARDPQSR